VNTDCAAEGWRCGRKQGKLHLTQDLPHLRRHHRGLFRSSFFFLLHPFIPAPLQRRATSLSLRRRRRRRRVRLLLPRARLTNAIKNEQDEEKEEEEGGGEEGLVLSVRTWVYHLTLTLDTPL